MASEGKVVLKLFYVVFQGGAEDGPVIEDEVDVLLEVCVLLEI